MSRAHRGSRAGTTVTWEDEVDLPGDEDHPAEESVPVHVEASVGAYDPGRSTGPWESSYPPEGGEVEDLGVYRVDTGEEVEPDAATRARLEAHAAEIARDEAEWDDGDRECDAAREDAC